MRKIILASLLLFTSPAWAGCPLIHLTPCHEVHRPSATARAVKSLTAAHRAQAVRVDDHDHRIATHDAQFKAMAASIAALQRQVAELKAAK
jgi:hypothetical protein